MIVLIEVWEQNCLLKVLSIPEFFKHYPRATIAEWRIIEKTKDKLVYCYDRY